MLSTLTFVMVACLFADFCYEKGGDVVAFVKSKL
jgi:hypothetical protein